MKPSLLAFLVTLAASSFSYAAEKKTVCRGALELGSLDSSIGECTFLSKSSAASKILKICDSGDECEVTAIVNGELIKNVISVRAIKKAQ